MEERKNSGVIPRAGSGRGGGLLFVAGLFFYLFVQAGMTWSVLAQRSAPVETDDAYTYIIKAEQLRYCFTQDCPALADLRGQLAEPVSDPELNWIRFREFSRLFVVYHPLHSLLLWGLRLCGLEWENAYDAVFLGGRIFLALAAAYWLLALWGPGPAGVALFFLACEIFPGQGLHYVVPTNLALGVAMLTWATALRPGRFRPAFTLAGILAMLALHPMGRIFGVVSVIFFWGFAPKPRMWRTWAVALAGLAMVGSAFLLPHLVSRPLLAFSAEPAPPGFSSFTGILKNLRAAAVAVYHWSRLFGESAGGVGVFLFATIGFYSVTDPQKRKQAAVTGGVLVLLLAAGLGHVLPRYPAEMFYRLWAPAAVCLMGAAGAYTLSWLAAISAWAKNFLLRRKEPLLWLPELFHYIPPHFHPLIHLGMFFLLGFTVDSHLQNLLLSQEEMYRLSFTKSFTVKSTIRKMVERQPVRLEADQPARLFSRSRGDEAVLYLDEVPMHFYLSHGALTYHAVYYPGIRGRPQEKPLVRENKNLRFLVGWNPVEQLPSAWEGGVLLAADRLEIQSLAPLPLNRVLLRLRNPSPKNITLLVSGATTLLPDQPILLTVPPGSDAWVPLSSRQDLWSADLVLQLQNPEPRLEIKGLRLSPHDSRNWPWDEGIRLVFQPSGDELKSSAISFDSQQLCPTLNRPVSVISDEGSTVLGEIGE